MSVLIRIINAKFQTIPLKSFLSRALNAKQAFAIMRMMQINSIMILKI